MKPESFGCPVQGGTGVKGETPGSRAVSGLGAGHGPRLLASVRNVEEAMCVARWGADVVDLKEPAAGALGAVDAAMQSAILDALGPARPLVSATVGDLAFDAGLIADAIERTAGMNVDFVKFGVFGSPDPDTAQRGFAALAAKLASRDAATPLVLVLLADQLHSEGQLLDMLEASRQLGSVRGVVLDTALKGSGSHCLPDLFRLESLHRFVGTCHDQGRFAALAGSLRAEHVPALATTGADLLGFRGALCSGSRTGQLSASAYAEVAEQLSTARAWRRACASASNTRRFSTEGV